ncbi:unnamed protein product [Tetraodon nigroviridis]|uniref:(spotted green pufferfish) hypothetical protein n=1 Tax=Tetraodon nigroviridis TaxID=99883 RepID=Q4SGH5_TETNG|nr:unnamed protein product [Tetraodon nigroviridis]
MESLKYYLTHECVYWLKKRSPPPPLPSPAWLQASTLAEPLLSWRRGEEELHEEVEPGEILPNPDGTFQMSAALDLSSVPPEDWSSYKCVFQLSGGQEVPTSLDRKRIRTNWEENPSNTSAIVGVVAAVLVLVLGAIAGFLVYRQKKGKCPRVNQELVACVVSGSQILELLHPHRLKISQAPPPPENNVEVALFLFTLFIFGAMMGLRTLKPSDGFSDLAPGMDLAAERSDRRRLDLRDPAGPAGRRRAPFTWTAATPRWCSPGGPGLRHLLRRAHLLLPVVRGPSVDNKYIHWDHVLVPHWDPKIAAGHAKGRHAPPEDIASSFYPELGPYSSRDQTVLESHMAQIEASAAGKRSRPAGFLPDGCCQPRLNNLPVRLVAPETLLSPDQPENRLLPAWFRLPLTQTTKAPVRSSRTPTWAGPEPVESQPVEGLADTLPPCWPPSAHAAFNLLQGCWWCPGILPGWRTSTADPPRTWFLPSWMRPTGAASRWPFTYSHTKGGRSRPCMTTSNTSSTDQHGSGSAAVLRLRLLPDAARVLGGAPDGRRRSQHPRDPVRRRFRGPHRGGAPQARHPRQRLRRHLHLLRLQRLLLRLLPPELESHQELLRRQQPALHPQRGSRLRGHGRAALEQPQHPQPGERALLRDGPAGGPVRAAGGGHHHVLQPVARGHADREGRPQEDGVPPVSGLPAPPARPLLAADAPVGPELQQGEGQLADVSPADPQPTPSRPQLTPS